MAKKQKVKKPKKPKVKLFTAFQKKIIAGVVLRLLPFFAAFALLLVNNRYWHYKSVSGVGLLIIAFSMYLIIQHMNKTNDIVRVQQSDILKAAQEYIAENYPTFTCTKVSENIQLQRFHNCIITGPLEICGTFDDIDFIYRRIEVYSDDLYELNRQSRGYVYVGSCLSFNDQELYEQNSDYSEFNIEECMDYIQKSIKQ